jgi:hypothetical protein
VFRLLQKNLSRRLKEVENSSRVTVCVQKILDRMIPVPRCEVEFQISTGTVTVTTANKTIATEASYALEKISAGLREEGIQVKKIIIR